MTGSPPPAAPSWRARLHLTRAFLAHWLVLLAFWITLSGLFDPLHLGAGVICTALVAALTYEMEFVDRAKSPLRPFHLAPVPWHRLAWYSVWLLREIAVANWQVLKIVMNPRLPIDPVIVRFRTSLTTDLGRTTLANSITLTPGTITVQVNDDEFLIHALQAGPGIAGDISRMQHHVARALPRLETIVEPDS